MQKPKVSAKEISEDIRAGLSNTQIRLKYGLSSKQLESVFRKLVSAGLFSEAELSSRHKSARREAPTLSDKAEAVLADLKAGGHKMEIMSRHELSPSQYDNILSELIQSGALPQSEIDSREPAKTIKCRYCSARVPADREQCPSCQQWLDGRDATPERIAERIQPSGIAAQTLVSDKYCAWEDRESIGLFNAFLQTAVKCLINPSSFFSELPLDRGYLNPMAFGVVASWVGVFLLVVLYMIFKGGLGLFGLLIVSAIALVAIVPGTLLWLTLLGLAVHGCLVLVGGSSSGMQATFRVISYAAAANVFNAIPVVGNIVAYIYGLVLSVIGLKQTHDTTTGKATAAVLIPLGIILIISLISFVPAMVSSPSSDREGTEAAEAKYPDAQIAPGLCKVIDTFISQVEAAVTLDSTEDARDEIQKAVMGFVEEANKFSSEPSLMKIGRLANQFAKTHFARVRLRHKHGTLPEDAARRYDPEPYKRKLLEMCGY